MTGRLHRPWTRRRRAPAPRRPGRSRAAWRRSAGVPRNERCSSPRSCSSPAPPSAPAASSWSRRRRTGAHRSSAPRRAGASRRCACSASAAWLCATSASPGRTDPPSCCLICAPVRPGFSAPATWQPAVSERYVVWFEGAGEGASSADAWTYDVATRRRRQIATLDDVLSFPSVSAARTVWCAARDAESRIVGVDLTNDKGLVVASEYGRPVIDGALVAWARSSGGGPSSFVLADVTQGRSWTVIPSGLGGAAGLTGFDLSGRTLVWGQQDAQTAVGRIVAQNVDTGAASIVAEGARMATAPSIDGDTVVWAEQTPDAAAYRVMGRRLRGGPSFQIARVDGQVQSALVSGGIVAWLVDNGDRSPTWIETARIPR